MTDAQPETIGVAFMESDGTLVLRLHATSEGILADGQVTYTPDSEHYHEVLKHLGGLKPGETKPVPPWPAAAS